MKIRKNGQVKVEANEVRVGNFFVKREDLQLKLTDLNGVFHHAVSRQVPIGIWLENMWARAMNADEGAIKTLQVYISSMWSLFSVAPDDEFIQDVINSARGALERHPDWYGFNPDATEKEDAEAATEVKEMKEFEEELKHFDENAAEGKEGEVPVKE